jgi:hypothetical protein
MHVGGAHEDRVRMADLGGDLVAIARQAIESRNCDVVERENLEARHPRRRSKSAMKSVSAATPASGIAL